MKDTLIILLSAFGGIGGVFLFIKMVYYWIKNDLKNDRDVKEIHNRIKDLEQKHHNSISKKESRYDEEVHNRLFNNQSNTAELVKVSTIK